MAYYDYDGTITIDEQAARSDIRKIAAALPELEAAKAAMDRIYSEGSNTQGETGRAVVDKADELRKKLEQTMQALRETQELIQRTVNHYQRLDREVKAMIQAASLAGE